MTSKELEDLLILSINQNTMAQGTAVFSIDNSKSVAKSILKLAVRKVGRLQAVAFNRARVTFTLTNGVSVYDIGPDILKDFPSIWGLEFMYVTTFPGRRTEFVTLDKFRDNSTRTTVTQRPRLATLNSKDRTFEVWPVPDDNYEMIAQAKENVEKLVDIPDEYHDIVLAEGYRLIHAARSGGMASLMAEEGKEDIERDQQPSWTGSRILPTRVIGREISRIRPDSLDVTGDF